MGIESRNFGHQASEIPPTLLKKEVVQAVDGVQKEEKKNPRVRVARELTDEMREKLHEFHDAYEAGEPDTRTHEQRERDKDMHGAEPYAHLFYLEDDGSVSGAIDLFQREVMLDGEKIRVGGIGGVATLKEKRGKGIASDLLQQAVAELNADAMDVAFLNTDIKDPKLVRLYQRVGFEIFDRPYIFRGRSGQRYEERDGMIAPVRSKDKMKKIQQSEQPFDIGQGNW